MVEYFSDRRILLPIAAIWLSLGLFGYAGFVGNVNLLISSGASIVVFVLLGIYVRKRLVEEERNKV